MAEQNLTKPNESQQQEIAANLDPTPAELLGLQDGGFKVERTDGTVETGWTLQGTELTIIKPGEEPVELATIIKPGTKGEEELSKKVVLTELLSWQEPEEDLDVTVPRNKPSGASQEQAADYEKTSLIDGQINALNEHLDTMERLNTYDAGQSTGNLIDYVQRGEVFQKVDGLSTYFKGAILGSLKNVNFADSYFSAVDKEIQSIAAGNTALVAQLRSLISPARELVQRREYEGDNPVVNESRAQFAVMLAESARRLSVTAEDEQVQKSVKLLLQGVATGVSPSRERAMFLQESRKVLMQ